MLRNVMDGGRRLEGLCCGGTNMGSDLHEDPKPLKARLPLAPVAKRPPRPGTDQQGSPPSAQVGSASQPTAGCIAEKGQTPPPPLRAGRRPGRIGDVKEHYFRTSPKLVAATRAA